MSSATGAAVVFAILAVAEVERGGAVHSTVAHMYTFAAIGLAVLGIAIEIVREKRK